MGVEVRGQLCAGVVVVVVLRACVCVCGYVCVLFCGHQLHRTNYINPLLNDLD